MGGFHFQQIPQTNAIHFVSHGKGQIIHRNQSYEIHPGDLFILMKGEFYEYSDDPESPWKYTYCHMNGNASDRLLSKIGLHPTRPIIQTANKHGLTAAFTHLRHLFESGSINGYSSISQAWTLLEQLEIAIGQQKASSASPAQFAKRLIDQSPQCISNVDMVADYLGISRTTLFRQFKAAYGISVKHYIETVRFDRILQLIQHTALPLSQIAETGGFTDPLYFSRAFRKRFGTSPTELRNQNR